MAAVSCNLWFGVTMNMDIPNTVFYVASMLCVGFLEEVIFRGLLFKAMEKDSLKAAIVVTSLTFGIGARYTYEFGANAKGDGAANLGTY